MSSSCKIGDFLAGKPIVSIAWITACSMSGRFVAAQDHLLVDTAAEQNFKFSLSSAYQAAQRSLLLASINIWMTPGRHLISTAYCFIFFENTRSSLATQCTNSVGISIATLQNFRGNSAVMTACSRVNGFVL